jgi:hypothetical protein
MVEFQCSQDTQMLIGQEITHKEFNYRNLYSNLESVVDWSSWFQPIVVFQQLRLNTRQWEKQQKNIV